MKVAIVQEHVDLARGGAETSTVEMARHLAALGLNVHVVCRGKDSAPFVDHNVTYLPIATRGFWRAEQTYHYVQAATRLFRRERFDIVHAITPCLSANVYQPRGGTYAAAIAGTLARVRSPVWRAFKQLGRRLNVRQRFLYHLEAKLLRHKGGRPHVAAVSALVRQQVLALNVLPAERVHVVFNGVDGSLIARPTRVAARRQLDLDPEQPLALFAAHNFKLKGLSELLRAMAISSQRWNLVVVGRDDPQAFQRLARRLGIAERVSFHGGHDGLGVWYAAADALAHPTWYDPCSRVVLEALSVGLPVVTTRFNGAAEVIENGRHGVVIARPDDVEGLAAAIDAALTAELRRTCQADSAHMAERLSMARHARELLALYEEIVA